jgi:hypothetical protein
VAFALFVALTIPDSKPAISLSIVGYSTNLWSQGIGRTATDGDQIFVRLALTNQTDRAVTYWEFLSDSSDRHLTRANYRLVHRSALRWKDSPVVLQGPIAMRSCTLPPSSGFTFEASVTTNEVCKVALDYLDGRTPNPLWRRLPVWLFRRIPWATNHRTVYSDAVDLNTRGR